jgi:hypothetical protein
VKYFSRICADLSADLRRGISIRSNNICEDLRRHLRKSARNNKIEHVSMPNEMKNEKRKMQNGT